MNSYFTTDNNQTEHICKPMLPFEKNDDDISVPLCDKRPSYRTVRNWVAGFGTGHLSTRIENVLGEKLKYENSRKYTCHSFRDPGHKTIIR
jgi:hypothetical protein